MTAPLTIHRSRVVIRVWGRDPVKMIQGLATADIHAVAADRAAYTTFLTVKGRMIADARVLLRPGGHQPPELLLTTHADAAPGLLEHLRKFIPPLFARFEDVSDDWRVIGVYGEGASAAAAAALDAAAGQQGGAVEGWLSSGLSEDAVIAAPDEAPALAMRTSETGGDGWDLLVPASAEDRVWAALSAAGAVTASEDELEPLRIAAGRPRWGAELTGDVIPLEAGLERAISQTKGCYTGQEVIIRILHRGHVNRHLRALTFSAPAPSPGTELFEPGNEKVRGVVTSVAPAPDGGAGLGYVRREIQPPAELRAGSPDGPAVHVSALP
ncbi:MAG: hypothetical protein KY466_08935 [Gemmatimonadetes bacterium]|nr:hypothetical protein [Gemmatimonadota bacterium]